ncbi:RNA polymerase sigma-54 factor, partial [Azospirillum brasilense]|nr:RNA polymerase sigma-54 factor [Azospirillum brasilense]
MALSQRLDLRQSQSLVMTPQLQQAIKLLQLSNIELSDFVDREIEQNPLLERDGGSGEGGGESGGDGAGDGGGGPGAEGLDAPGGRRPPGTDGATRETGWMT